MLENTIEAAKISRYTNLTFQSYANFVTEGVSNRHSRQETFIHNLPRQVSDAQSWRSSQGRGRKSARGRGRRRSKGISYAGREYQGPSFQCEGITFYTKKNHSREEYGKLSITQKNEIRLARLKELKKSDDTSTISEVTSTLTSRFTNMQESIVQGVRNASTDNNNLTTSSKRNSTATPTQQLKKRKYGAGNEDE